MASIPKSAIRNPQPAIRHLSFPHAALLALFPLVSSGVVAGERPIVREIAIQGFLGDPAAIKGIIQTREGAPFDPETLNADLGRLLSAGYLPAPPRVLPVPGGVRLILEVTQNPRIRTLRVTGAGSWNSSLKEELLTRQGDAVPALVLTLPEAERFRADKERLRAYCQERGYKDVDVKSAVTRVPKTSQIDLTFPVTLGPKYQVKWLRFQGNKSLSSRELAAVMQTKLDTVLTSRRYSDQVFQKDIEGLQDYCRYKGLPDAKVTFRRAFRGPAKNHVDITIRVEEGRSYGVAAITAKGNKAISSPTLLAAIPLKVGQTYSDEKLLESTHKIERLYKESGYPFISVRPTRDPGEKGNVFNVLFDIAEGEQVRIHKVLTRGNVRTRYRVIFRELELNPNDLYDIRKLERTQRALDRLQFFDAATLELVPTEPAKVGWRDLLVRVTEGHTGAIRFGIGFSTVNALVGDIEYIQRNFDWRDKAKSWRDALSGDAYVGAGQFFRVALMPGTIYSSFLIQYENPYWRFHNGRNESFGWSLYYRSRDQDTWLERRIGGGLAWGIRKWRGDPDTNLMWRARLEAVSVTHVDDDDAPDDARDARGTHPLFGIGPTLERDRTDRPILPTSGFRWSTGAEAVIPHGVKLATEGTRFWTLGQQPKGHERVLSLRGGLDYELGSFPIYERLYAGAPYLRGFAYRGVGPRQNDEPIGGQFRAVLSGEYRYPLAANTLYSVFFVDAGTVTKDFSVVAPRVAVGLGFRLALPFLSRTPVALDFGVPVVRRGGDESEFLYFSVSIDR